MSMPPVATGLRERAARGTLVNAAFLAGLNALSLVKAFVVAGFLTRSEYGVWSILLIGMGTLIGLKQVGFSDKYVQQEASDQDDAFRRAFTLELIAGAVAFGLALLALPLLVLLYGQSEILLPGLVYALVVPALSLQAPAWIHYRRMDYLRQRLVLSVDPAVGFVTTVALAAAGLGYWSLVIGIVVGSWSGAAVALATSPIRPGWRYERVTLREYLDFSWPVFVAIGSAVLMAQLAIFVGEASLGLAGAGTILLALSAGMFADKVDAILSQTLYPAVCAVRDRTDLLFETFTKSNRLALMWGFPFGVGLALFAPDMVEYAIGDRWEPATTLIQVIGLSAAVNQIGFNWTVYYRARDDTRPIAVSGALTFAVFAAVTVPLLATEGLDGMAVGMAAVTLTALSCRTYYVMRLFPDFQFFSHAARAVAPSVVPVLAVLLMRLVEDGRSAGMAAIEVVVYLFLTAAGTLLLERSLLREVAGYLGLGQRRATARA